MQWASPSSAPYQFKAPQEDTPPRFLQKSPGEGGGSILKIMHRLLHKGIADLDELCANTDANHCTKFSNFISLIFFILKNKELPPNICFSSKRNKRKNIESYPIFPSSWNKYCKNLRGGPLPLLELCKLWLTGLSHFGTNSGKSEGLSGKFSLGRSLG